MNPTLLFIGNAIAFGVGLSMDAFSISIAAGLAETHMKKSRMAVIAGTFGGFQILMPLAGWLCVHTVAEAFSSFQKFIPWIAFILLGYIGGKMLLEGIRKLRGGADTSSAGRSADPASGASSADRSAASLSDASSGDPFAASLSGASSAGYSQQTDLPSEGSAALPAASPVATAKDLLLLGIATAIDALSVGFTIADLSAPSAIAEALIIGVVTFVICWCGLHLGKRAGARLSDKAAILGGSILLLIGIEILVRSLR